MEDSFLIVLLSSVTSFSSIAVTHRSSYGTRLKAYVKSFVSVLNRTIDLLMFRSIRIKYNLLYL